MAKEYKTLQFPNTPAGQKQKVETINQMATEGWKVTSETITEGEFKGGKACCLGVIFLPLALCAGHKKGTINVTLERDT
jgi:hypothetical protein